MSSLSEGKVKKEVYTVTKAETAFTIGSGGLNVLATPVLVRWIEEIAYKFIQENLQEDLTSVGSKLDIKHFSPTPIYEKVTVTVKLEKIIKNVYQFSFTAEDEVTQIAAGTHTRVIVDVEKFLNNLSKKHESR